MTTMDEQKAYAVIRTGAVEVKDKLDFDPATERITGQLAYTGYLVRLELGHDDWQYVFDPPLPVVLGKTEIDWPLGATEYRIS